jgi:hypothetical protein
LSFDIFKQQPDSKAYWIEAAQEAAQEMDTAKARTREVAEYYPGQDIVIDNTTGKKVFHQTPALGAVAEAAENLIDNFGAGEEGEGRKPRFYRGFGGPWLTILELFRQARSSRGFRTSDRPRCFDSDEDHQAPSSSAPKGPSRRRHWKPGDIADLSRDGTKQD